LHAAGVALAPGPSSRAVLAPLAAACCGAALGFLISFNDPSLGDPRFAAGAAAAGSA